MPFQRANHQAKARSGPSAGGRPSDPGHVTIRLMTSKSQDAIHTPSLRVFSTSLIPRPLAGTTLTPRPGEQPPSQAQRDAAKGVRSCERAGLNCIQPKAVSQRKANLHRTRLSASAPPSHKASSGIDQS